jgi:hypothetical protein
MGTFGPWFLLRGVEWLVRERHRLRTESTSEFRDTFRGDVQEGRQTVNVECEVQLAARQTLENKGETEPQELAHICDSRGAKDPEVRTPVLRGFLLVRASYGSLISLPVRHHFDSHPTLPYIATVLLIPRAVGIIHARVGFP